MTKGKYRRLIVGMDGSEASVHAFREALRLEPEEVSAVYASAPPGAREPGERESWSREQGEQALAVCRDMAGEAEISLEVIQGLGEPYEVLVKLAKERGGDLLVTGRRGLDLPEKAMMGSTTARVIGFSPRDVLVVPRGARLNLSRMVVATDGSRFSQRVAVRAVELARAYGGALEVAAALDAPPWFVEEMPEAAAVLLQKLQDLTAQIAGQAESVGICARTWVRLGPAYRVITDLAGELDAGLIIVGSHGRTGLKRLLMGSVTERVIGYATCPVLVVKEGK